MAWPSVCGTVRSFGGVLRRGSSGLRCVPDQGPVNCKMLAHRCTAPDALTTAPSRLLHHAAAFSQPTTSTAWLQTPSTSSKWLHPPFTSTRPIPAASTFKCNSGRGTKSAGVNRTAINGRELHTHHKTAGSSAADSPFHRPPQLVIPRHIRTLTSSSEISYLNSDFFYPDRVLSAPLFLVLLNYKLPRCVSWLWNKAVFKICADGGANQLYDRIPTFVEGDPKQLRQQYWPDLIVGDLDSIREEVQDFYAAGGTPVRDLSYDQDSTDACKCLMHIEEKLLTKGEPHTILVCGGLGGRLDHTLANLNVLHKFPHLNVILIGDGNMARLVRPGKTVIRSGPESLEGPRCGLVPLLCPAVVSSTGLRWNVNETLLSMSGLVSTSNMLAGTGEVTVETDQPLVWMTEVESDQEPAGLSRMCGDRHSNHTKQEGK